MSRSRAFYAILSNDHDSAITLLEKAFQQGFYIDTVAETALPFLKPLDGDPRYETAKTAMLERWNAEMEKIANEQNL